MKKRHIFSCIRGASVIEFALVAPVLFLFLVGFLELSLIAFTHSVLEGATNVGSRLGKTGYTAEDTPREDYIRQEIIRLSGNFLDLNNLKIEVLAYGRFEDIGKPEPCTHVDDLPPCPDGFIDVNGDGKWSEDQGKLGPGKNGEIVLYRVEYPWPIFTPMMGKIIGDDGNVIHISAIATVKNEGF